MKKENKMMRHKPMLAYPVSKKPIDYKTKNFIQPKLDGVRCLIQYDNSEVTAYSRTGKQWKNIDHILNDLKFFFQCNPDVVLDGELYNHDLKDDFEKIISCVRKTKPTSEHRLESKQLVQFHCYDAILSDRFKDTNWSGNFDLRNEWVHLNLPRTYCVKYVETHEVWAEKFSKQIHGINLSKGYEGSILRTNSQYQSKRSHSLRKLKDFHDSEATITSWVEGKGKRVGTIGKFMVKQLPLRTSNVLKLVVTDTLCLNVYEIMNKSQIKRMKISKLVQKLYEEEKITLRVAVQLLDKIYED